MFDRAKLFIPQHIFGVINDVYNEMPIEHDMRSYQVDPSNENAVQMLKTISIPEPSH